MPGEIRSEKRVSRTGERTMLIVSSTEKGRETLREMLSGSVFRVAGFAENGGEARRLLLSQQFDAAVVNAPLPDELGVKLSLFLAEEGMTAVFLVKNEQAEEAAIRLAPAGIITLGKPFSRGRFHEALGLMDAVARRSEGLLLENRRLREKLTEARLVGRAKCFLAIYRGLTEGEAHRFIEKEAMDRRISRREVAQELIGLYGEEE